jgi:hypothetical protein
MFTGRLSAVTSLSGMANALTSGMMSVRTPTTAEMNRMMMMDGMRFLEKTAKSAKGENLLMSGLVAGSVIVEVRVGDKT